MNQDQFSGGVRLSATNIGGIDYTEVEFDAGVTILEGRNATNRTSLLQALMAVLGSEDVSLKADADEGRVELVLDGHRYTRTLERKNGTIVTGGDPYLEETELADLFAFLIESNEARRAVTRGDDLHDLIMRPVDTEAIQREIRQLNQEKREIDDELAEIDSLKGELPQLEQERTRLESEIEEKREELEEKTRELEAADADVDETRQEKAELEDRLEELRETRSTLEDVRFDIETEEESLDALRDERTELQTELEELTETPMGDVEELEARTSELRERKRTLDAELSELQSTIQFNEEMLDDAASSTYTSWLGESGSTGSVTDQLVVGGEEVTCWTCGSEVQRDQITATLDQLRSLRQEKLDESQTVQQELEELADEKDRLEAQRRQRDDVDRRLDRIEDEIEERTDDLEALRGRRDRLTEEIRELETDIDALEDQEYGEILDLHKEANELEFELGRLESELDDVNDEIEAIEDRLTEQKQLEERRADVRTELDELRTRIEEIERRAIEQFNDHMEAILDILDYTNLERIWIERTRTEVRQGREKTTQTNFELHIVRRSESDATYEDTVDHLSESERETTGLIFALAGYLVHDVHETVPFMLLDSLEAIDSERIAALIEYFGEYAEYLVVALLSEDASAVDVDTHRITSI
jgi:septal ring factor EnvC (AmiA/AmiB activator)